MKFAFICDAAGQDCTISPDFITNWIDAWAVVFGPAPRICGMKMRPKDPLFRTSKEMESGVKVLDDLAILNQYDVVMINLSIPLCESAIRIKKETNVKVVGLFEGQVGYLSQWDYQDKKIFIDAMNAVDLMGVLVEEAIPFYQMLTTTPVEFIGVPYPVEWAKKLYKLRKEKENRVIQINGLTDYERGGFVNVSVANNFCNQYKFENWVLKKEVSMIRCSFCGSGFAERVVTKGDFEKFMGFCLHYYRHTGYPEFMPKVAGSLLAFHMEQAQSLGNFSMDCACVGTPCVNVNRSNTQKELFPDITLENPYDVQGAFNLLEKLLSDGSFYDQVVAVAFERVDKWSYENSKLRFLNVLENHSIWVDK